MVINKQSAKVCVIGGGIIGSWTALHLAEAGARTTLVEQFPLPHTRGSSHGLSRAFRFLGELELGRLDYSLDRIREISAVTPTLCKVSPSSQYHVEDVDEAKPVEVLRVDELDMQVVDG